RCSPRTRRSCRRGSGRRRAAGPRKPRRRPRGRRGSRSAERRRACRHEPWAHATRQEARVAGVSPPIYPRLVIEVESVSKLYSLPGYKTFRALDGVSFVARPGRVLGLLGPNGAGKTTTLRIVSTVLRPTSGRARVCGHDT